MFRFPHDFVRRLRWQRTAHIVFHLRCRARISPLFRFRSVCDSDARVVRRRLGIKRAPRTVTQDVSPSSLSACAPSRCTSGRRRARHARLNLAAAAAVMHYLCAGLVSAARRPARRCRVKSRPVRSGLALSCPHHAFDLSSPSARMLRSSLFLPNVLDNGQRSKTGVKIACVFTLKNKCTF